MKQTLLHVGNAPASINELKADAFVGGALRELKVNLVVKYGESIDYGNGLVVKELNGVTGDSVLNVVRSYRKRVLSFWVKSSSNGATIGEYDYDSDTLRLFGLNIQ